MIKLNPTFPLIWRSPTSIQIGIDRPLAIAESITLGQERFLSALRTGIPEHSLHAIAKECSLNAAELQSTLALFSEACRPESRSPRWRICLDGSHGAIGSMGEIFSRLGHNVVTAGATSEPHADVVFLIADFVQPLHRSGDWHRRNKPHIPVTFGDVVVEIGPILGLEDAAPCATCIALARRDRDSAWPVMATQLSGMFSALPTVLVVHEVTTILARWVTHPDTLGISAYHSVVIDVATGHRELRSFSVHAECACQTLPQNATADVP
jgi:hypothetical protein